MPLSNFYGVILGVIYSQG